MKNQQNELEYPWDHMLPEQAQLHPVAKGVYWLRMPLPFALDHINLWLLEDEIEGQKGWTLVDTGIARPEVKAIWEQLEQQALQGLPILRVVVTHMHPDHVGLAGWLCERWQCPLYMSLTDYALASLWATPTAHSAQMGGTGGEAAAAHFARHGLTDSAALEQIAQRGSYYADMVGAPPVRFNRLIEGGQLEINGHSWRCISGYGHAPEHIALYCADLQLLISGDMVLPTISTNVSVFAYEPEANPLQLYLESLDAYLVLPEQTLVLPSHGRPFKGLHTRIQQLKTHHDARLEDTRLACSQPTGCNAAELLPILFKRKLDMHQLSFAMGEAIAHLHMLYFKGQLKRELNNEIYTFYTVDKA